MFTGFTQNKCIMNQSTWINPCIYIQLFSKVLTTHLYMKAEKQHRINRITHLLTESLTALATDGVSRVTLGSGDWG